MPHNLCCNTSREGFDTRLADSIMICFNFSLVDLLTGAIYSMKFSHVASLQPRDLTPDWSTLVNLTPKPWYGLLQLTHLKTDTSLSVNPPTAARRTSGSMRRGCCCRPSISTAGCGTRSTSRWGSETTRPRRRGWRCEPACRGSFSTQLQS